MKSGCEAGRQAGNYISYTSFSRFMKNLLIFDYDGVLVDSFDIFMTQFIRACEREGMHHIAGREQFLELFEGNMYEGMLGMGMQKEQILRIVYTMRDGLRRQQKNLRLFKGIKEALHELSKEHALMIVTSNETRTVAEFLDAHRIHFFDEVIGSDREPSKVKKIEYIRTTYAGYQYFYIGDTAGDIREGRCAGVKTVAVTWGWHTEQRLREASPDYLVHSPEELVHLFRGRHPRE